MIDLSRHEQEAIAAASPAAGEYLERIGKTDLATMTEEEWLGFLANAFTQTTTQLRDIVDRNAVPF